MANEQSWLVRSAMAAGRRDAAFAEAQRLQRATEQMQPDPDTYGYGYTPGRVTRPIDRNSRGIPQSTIYTGEDNPELKPTSVKGMGGRLPGANNLFARQGIDLTISHVATGLQVAFPAFLELISDAYTSDWDEESVFGRMDAIPTFRSTRRTLSVAWNVPGESFEASVENVGRVNKLISFLYPLYDYSRVSQGDKQVGGAGATAINQSPLVRVSFGNLIQDAVTGRGLLGHLQGLTFDPVLEHGMFSRKLTKTGKDGVAVEYFPKTFRLNFELTVLHGHELGFKTQKDAEQRFQHLDRDVSFHNFPYGAPAASGLAQEEKTVYKITQHKVAAEVIPGNVLQPIEVALPIAEETRATVNATPPPEPYDMNDDIGGASWGGP